MEMSCGEKSPEGLRIRLIRQTRKVKRQADPEMLFSNLTYRISVGRSVGRSVGQSLFTHGKIQNKSYLNFCSDRSHARDIMIRARITCF